MEAPEVAGTLLMVNPASAGGATLRRLPEILDALRHTDIAFDVHLTTEPGEATERCREALRSGVGRVVAVGGDGTINEVVNGYFEVTGGNPVAPDAQLGLIPSGTGGDFRRTLGGGGLDRAVAALTEGRTRRLDAGRIEVDTPSVAGGNRISYFINVADWGVGGEVVARVNRSRFKRAGPRGSAIFLGVSLSELWGYGVREVDLVIDGMTLRRRVSNVVVANGQYFGGGMHVAPRARLDDGAFDIVLIGAMPHWRMLLGIPRLYRGTHLGMPGIELFRGKKVRIVPTGDRPLRFEAEGELAGAGAATVTCLPGAIPFVGA